MSLTLFNLDLTIECGPDEFLHIASAISVTILDGAIFNVYGKNGSGKSTLLKHIAGLYDIQPGTLLVNNNDVTDHFDEYRSMIFYMGHKFGFKLDLSVIDNLMFWAKLFDSELMLESVIVLFKFEAKLNEAVKNLSAGNQKKLALAVAMLSKSDIWLLDEPFANLDAHWQDVLWNVFDAKVAQGGIIVFSSHKPECSKKIAQLSIDDYKKHAK